MSSTLSGCEQESSGVISHGNLPQSFARPFKSKSCKKAKQASRQAGRQAGKQESKKARKQESKKASKQASKQKKRASKQEDQPNQPTTNEPAKKPTNQRTNANENERTTSTKQTSCFALDFGWNLVAIFAAGCGKDPGCTEDHPVTNVSLSGLEPLISYSRHDSTGSKILQAQLALSTTAVRFFKRADLALI